MLIRKIKKSLAITVVTALLLVNMVPAYAFEVPTAPSAPASPPQTETSQSAFDPAPTPPPAPESDTVAPTPPPAPTVDEALADGASVNQDGTQNSNPDDPDGATSTDDNTQSTNEQSAQNGDGISSNGNVGDTSIGTGDATNTGNIFSTGNLNASITPSGVDGSVSIISDGNGAGSDNTGSVTLVDTNNTFQDNTANVTNGLDQNANTGENSASQNVGNSEITTGDANVSGTVITAVNTNVDGVAVAEFTVANDYTGDILLDFNTGCIAGCGTGSITAENTSNGSDSQNQADVTQVTNNNTFQNNDATVESNLTLASNSGDNTASENTNGNSTITTGDTNVVANVLTFANNNLLGNVLFGVVNIFGDLIGDIILPESALVCSTCGGSATAANSNNGSNSTNDASITQTTNDATFQSNDATIDNNLLLAATTGDNETSGNTGGNSTISTGDSTIDVNALNVANSNIDGGTWWLVIVNKAGQWIGQILGAPTDSNFAGSAGTEFTVGPNGEIIATNTENGSGSDNTANVSQTTNNTTVQTNTAHVVNNLDLSANTGGNEASKNTGGNSSITTGDASIIANLVNFVNNNVSSNGRLIVTVINVFGSWIGDFVTPGHEKQHESQTAQTANNTTQGGIGGSSSNGSGSNNNSSDANSGGTTVANSATVNINVGSGQRGGGGSRGGQALLAGFAANVAGVSNDDNANDNQQAQAGPAGSKKVKINLAFVLLLLPVIVFAAVARRFNRYSYVAKSYIVLIVLLMKRTML